MQRLDSARVAAAAAGAALFSSTAGAVNDLPGGPAVRQLNLHVPVTKIGEQQVFLHDFMLIVCLVIFVAVFSVMFYSILKHRKSLGHKSANFHESVGVEIAWTVVPLLIVIAMGAMATRTVVAMKDTSNADLTIKATGYQWKWGYDYLKGEGEGINFLQNLDVAQRLMSDSGKPAGDDYLLKVDNPLVVPVDKKVRIITTANDVIHSWMVPSLGVKQDAIPGFVRDTWFRAEKTGDYYGQCVELCGKEHAYMPIHVKVVSQADYATWVGAQKKQMEALADDPNKEWKMEDLVARGEKIYSANCAACHRPDGKGAGPIKPLDGSAIVLNDPAAQVNILLNGAANGAMPSWKQLSDTELAAVISYTKNNWSNRTGKYVQPSEVAAARAGKPVAFVHAPGGAAAPAPAAVAPAGGLPMSVLFATGKSALDAAAQTVLGERVAYLKANPTAKVALSGFVDSSGSAAQNAELAKQRAFAVRDALTKAGIAADRIELRKPSQIEAGNGSAAQARRVDIGPAG